MKRAGYSKTTKSSLISRGLAAKPVKSKRNAKSKKPPEAQPGYSLYSTDSEDQASVVGHGLDRCAALLSNILDNESSDQETRRTTSKVPGKTTKSLHSKNQPSGLRVEAIKKKHVVVPTAPNNQQVSPSPSRDITSVPRTTELHAKPLPATSYNDRLVSSTPVLNAEERERQQRLLKREQELTEQLQQLKQHYELLQHQKSPELQDQQKRQLQNAMLHELEDYQSFPGNQSAPSSQPHHANIYPEQDLSRNANSRTPRARRSLEYAATLGSLLSANHSHSESTPTNIGVQDKTLTSDRRISLPRHSMSQTPHYPENESSARKQVPDDFERSRERDYTKKHVRIVSPSPQEFRQQAATSMPSPPREGMDVGKYLHPDGSPSRDEDASRLRRPRSTPPSSRGGLSPSAVHNQTNTLQYLIRELREVIGSNDADLEVDRLLMELDHTASLLPYVYASHTPGQSYASHTPGQTTVEGDLAAQPLRLENAQLRRKLRIANQKLQEHESMRRNYEDLRSGQSSVSFELAACKSENASLQKRMYEEKERNEKLRNNIVDLEKVVGKLNDDKAKFMSILQNKEHDYTKGKRSSQLHSSRLSVEVNQLKAELEARKLSSEAIEKENTILNLSLKQKDAEIERLGDLTRGLQHTMKRVLLDVHDYHPDSVVREQLLRQPDILHQMGIALDSPVRLTTAASFKPPSLTASNRSFPAAQPHPATHDSLKEVEKPFERHNLFSRITSRFNSEDSIHHLDTNLDRPLLRSALDDSIPLHGGTKKTSPRVNGAATYGTRTQNPGAPLGALNGPLYSRQLLADTSPTGMKAQFGTKKESPGTAQTVLGGSIYPRQFSTDKSPRVAHSELGAKKQSPLRAHSPKTALSGRRRTTSPGKPLEGPGYLNTLAAFGIASNSVSANDVSVELSSLSSGDEEEFQRDLASLDADIARIQQSLRQTALKA